ncbi:MAG TPA: site-specific DNA-methyltransferase [Nitrolancea sp.]|nr:site-specific DNA-methyltransferase [Nitrolancea sp.]
MDDSSIPSETNCSTHTSADGVELATQFEPASDPDTVCFGDNLDLLALIPDGSIPLIYIDPPFNTGRTQSRTRLRTVRDPDGDRTGFQGRPYRTTRLSTHAYGDSFDDYLAFLEPRLREAYRVLAANGTLYLHLDYREVHYAKVMLDEIFGRASFLNEIIWAYDFGGRARNRWPAKHDNILVYVKSPRQYVFNTDAIDRVPYLAPGLVGPEKAARGKLPTDTWWQTIVSTNGRERTGYPTQKPLLILRRIIQASSNPGDLVLDFFAGSGTAGVAARELGRRFLLFDNNPDAISVMRQRFAAYEDVRFLRYDRRTESNGSDEEGDIRDPGRD